MWWFSRKGPSGFSASSTAEEVTQGIDGTGLTAIVTGHNPSGLIFFFLLLLLIIILGKKSEIWVSFFLNFYCCIINLLWRIWVGFCVGSGSFSLLLVSIGCVLLFCCMYLFELCWIHTSKMKCRSIGKFIFHGMSEHPLKRTFQ